MKTELLYLLKINSYKKGEFTLSSGRPSEHYVNCKPVTLSGKGLALTSFLLLNLIEDDTVVVGGLTLGADPLVSGVALAAVAKGRNLDALIVRKKSKGYGTNAWIEGPLPPKGSKVTVLEDVITTGGSAIQAALKIREAGYEVNRIVSIVDRQEGFEADNAMKSVNLELRTIFTLGDLINAKHEF